MLTKTRAFVAASILVALACLFQLFHGNFGAAKFDAFLTEIQTTIAVGKTSPPNGLWCRDLPGASDVVVVMRTGATEISDKIPIHFNTTFRCYNNLIVFSDYAETFNGYAIRDVLDSIDPAWKATNGDFDIYRRLQKYGRSGLRDNEFSGVESFEGSKSGKNDRPGWRLDKWKFLPMMNETIRLYPDKKWYVFVESDSYVVWSNLLQWLRELDPSKDLYYGSENQIGPDIFAHGGSVFVISRSAVQKGSDVYAKKPNEWHEWISKHWAGDCVLGKALLEAGVALTWSWPMFQGGHPEKMDFTEHKTLEKNLWCRPAMSYHHFSTEMRQMWEFEQNWIASRHRQATREGRQLWQNNQSDILHHSNVFRQFVLPKITSARSEWSNLSPDLVIERSDVDIGECRQMCEHNSNCLQYFVGPNGCSISSKEVMLGQRWKHHRSDWMVERVHKWMENMDRSCGGLQGWLVT